MAGEVRAMHHVDQAGSPDEDQDEDDPESAAVEATGPANGHEQARQGEQRRLDHEDRRPANVHLERKDEAGDDQEACGDPAPGVGGVDAHAGTPARSDRIMPRALMLPSPDVRPSPSASAARGGW